MSGPGQASSPSEVNQFDPGTLYEGYISVCEEKKSRNGNSFGMLRVETDLGEIEMSFFSRPACMKDLEPKDWHTMEKKPCVVSFTEKERGGKVWRNVETRNVETYGPS